MSGRTEVFLIGLIFLLISIPLIFDLIKMVWASFVGTFGVTATILLIVGIFFILFDKILRLLH
jgi:hypothetical protein